ncbi:MAG: hypothetical protein WCE79_24505 [Xanthobacteraceae bacterium]
MASARQALRKRSRREASGEEFSAWQKQMRSRANDRGACILLSANVESALERSLTNHLFYSVPRDEQLFSENGPLSSFHNKILMGRALRIYGPETLNNLECIRHIRNAFAHAHAPLSFATKEVKDVVDELTDLDVVYPRVYRERKVVFNRFSPRRKFEYVCNAIAHNLIVRALSPIQEVDQNALKPEISRREGDEFFFRIKPLP